MSDEGVGKGSKLTAAQRGLIKGVTNDEDSVDLDGAWAQLVAAQAVIAMKTDKGSPATTAARFVAQAAGLDTPASEPPDGLTLSEEEAARLKAWLSAAGYPDDDC